jgi:hypothetical protein
MRPLPYRLLAAFAVLPFVNGLLGFVGFPVVWYIGPMTRTRWRVRSES